MAGIVTHLHSPGAYDICQAAKATAAARRAAARAAETRAAGVAPAARNPTRAIDVARIGRLRFETVFRW